MSSGSDIRTIAFAFAGVQASFRVASAHVVNFEIPFGASEFSWWIFFGRYYGKLVNRPLVYPRLSVLSFIRSLFRLPQTCTFRESQQSNKKQIK